MIQNIQDIELLNQFNKTYTPKTWLQTYNYYNYLLSKGVKVELLGEIRNGALISACLFTVVEAKRGKAIQVLHGPIVPDFNSISIRQYIDLLKNKAKQNKCDFIRINTIFPTIEQVDLVFKTNGFIHTPFENMFANTSILDLTELSAQNLLSSYSPAMQTRLKKLIEIEQTGDIMVEFRDMVDEDCRPLTEQQTTEQQSFESIASVANYYASIKSSLVARLYYKKTLSAYQTYIINEGYICNHHGAVIENELEYNTFVHYKTMLKAIEMGIKFYDFWGISPKEDDKHPWNKSSVLKRQFSGDDYAYLGGYDFALTPKYWLTNMYEKYQKIKRGH
jgi:lipid II:glycine glycyltransferase (peptidoglycan interpeptide bridge formation enzyme)